MAAVKLYLPEALAERAERELPVEFSLSGLFQQALRQVLDGDPSCSHESVTCSGCGRVGAPAALLSAPALEVSSPG